MCDGEDGNVANLNLSQNGQDGEVGDQSGFKDQNARKRKITNEGFSDHEENFSSERDIRKSKSKKKKKKSSKGHKRSKRKRSSYSSTSSSTSSGSESSSDDDETSKPKSKKKKRSNLDEAMFHVQTDEEKDEYNLPKKLLKYADHYLKKFIPDKELEDSILTENSLPKNFMKVLSLDVFIRDTVTEERRNHELTMDSVLEKVQGKTRDVFGPLSRVWSYLHEVTSSDHEDEDESI